MVVEPPQQFQEELSLSGDKEQDRPGHQDLQTDERLRDRVVNRV